MYQKSGRAGRKCRPAFQGLLPNSKTSQDDYENSRTFQDCMNHVYFSLSQLGIGTSYNTRPCSAACLGGAVSSIKLDNIILIIDFFYA